MSCTIRGESVSQTLYFITLLLHELLKIVGSNGNKMSITVN